MKEEVFRNVNKIIVDHFDMVDNVTENDKLKDDLGLDSLDTVELVMECEKSFNISISDDIFDNINSFTVMEYVDYIHEHYLR